MTLRIAVAPSPVQDAILQALGAVKDVEIPPARTTAEFLRALNGAHVVVTPGAPRAYSPDVAAKIAASPDLAWVQLVSAGYDGVMAAGWPTGVTFTTSGGALSEAVAEHAFAVLTALSRQLPKAAVAQAAKGWERPYAPQATTLAGATLAVVGYGSIGQRVAKLSRGYDMTVLGVSRSGRPADSADEIYPASALLEVLPRADAVICALPFSRETRHVFDAAAFDRCKPGAFFVNVGRGGVVDQTALIAALRAGRLAGAGLDVTDPEPLPKDDPLWDAPNLLITPHYAAAGDRQAPLRMAEALIENIRRYRAGEPLINRLSAP